MYTHTHSRSHKHTHTHSCYHKAGTFALDIIDRIGGATLAIGPPTWCIDMIGSQFTCFTDTKVQILTQRNAGHRSVYLVHRYDRLSVYLLYWK